MGIRIFLRPIIVGHELREVVQVCAEGIHCRISIEHLRAHARTIKEETEIPFAPAQVQPDTVLDAGSRTIVRNKTLVIGVDDPIAVKIPIFDIADHRGSAHELRGMVIDLLLR